MQGGWCSFGVPGAGKPGQEWERGGWRGCRLGPPDIRDVPSTSQRASGGQLDVISEGRDPGAGVAPREYRHGRGWWGALQPWS